MAPDHISKIRYSYLNLKKLDRIHEKDLIRQLVYLQIDGAAKVTHESWKESRSEKKTLHLHFTNFTCLALSLVQRLMEVVADSR